MECALCVGLVTCNHATVMTHFYVFKKEKKKNEGRHSNTHIPDAAIVSSTLTCNPTRMLSNQVTYLKGLLWDPLP
jgi:hypothetical protein